MTKQQQHPITPPPELVRKWAKTCSPYDVPADHIATQAAQWGDDQRLQACCEWLREAANHGLGYDMGKVLADRLGAAMRSKPPSLAEQALALLDKAEDPSWDINDFSVIRRALELLQSYEKGEPMQELEGANG